MRNALSNTTRAAGSLALTLATACLAAVVAQPAQAASVSTWDKVAQCESTGNWAINTGNGYYGGLQFSLSTWKAFGGSQYAAYPHQATKQQQILIGEKVLAGQGQGAWPSCGPAAGLGADKADPYPTSSPRKSFAGVYRPSNQTFYERDGSGGTLGSAMFGNPGWTPLIGDFNGDGTDSVGVYDPATGDFHLSNDNGTAAISVRFGNPNWKPVVGDWNGDGKDTVGAYDPVGQKFYLSNDNSSVAASFVYGNAGDVPLAGDWNGDGKDTVAVYRPDNATFYEGDLAGNTVGNAMFGNPGWTPLIGDWNGDGVDSIGVYEPATQKFTLSNDNGSVATSFTYGNPGDIPITGAW
ncbi:transglycosylase family protein [Streptomyces sp. NPDC048424]|uniref:transglycosylase family protein n=1 Tax=Streptomyces sp. NPDC048424 TaxID=3155265 RepID=UPI0034324862